MLAPHSRVECDDAYFVVQYRHDNGDWYRASKKQHTFLASAQSEAASYATRHSVRVIEVREHWSVVE
ncbi:MAG: hypothetical protein AAGA42_02390 [Actinomycetota bacterium]